MWSLLASFGPEYGRGYSNHAPMVVESLELLGRAHLAEGWVAGHVAHLEAHPVRSDAPLVPGDGNHTGWAAHFASALTAADPEQVVADTAVSLAGGVAGGAGHGVLRAWHALRGWRRDPCAARLEELARGLGYWASSHRAAPAAAASGDLDPSDVLALVPRARTRPGRILERLAALDGDTIAQLCAAARLEPHPPTAAAQVRDTAARALRRGAGTTGLLHAVTVADAVGHLAGLVDQEAGTRLVTQAWGLTVSLFAIYGRPGTPPAAGPCAGRDAHIDAAVASGDPHLIKLAAVACSAAGGSDALCAALCEALGPLPHL